MEGFNRDLSALKNTLFDLLIIGGGINGAGIARDAAQRGFKVCLIDKGDFGSGTSSRSSKLVHGGLRYLEHGQFKLVHEALQERYHLLKIAPHLVRPLSFLLPIYRSQHRSPLKLKIGLSLYDRLAGEKNIHSHQKIAFKQLLEQTPELKRPGLDMAFHYYDAQMNDARLVLENILSAIESGATCLNYLNAIKFVQKESRITGIAAEDVMTQERLDIHSKLVINVTGPWLNQLLKGEKISTPKLRLTKGVHIVLPRLTGQHALLLFTKKDSRVFFCLPWGNYSLVGTTDTEYTDDPDKVHATREDVQYLLEEIQKFFPERKLTASDIVSTFAGVRPLIDQEGRAASHVSREYRIEETYPGLINILGGKFTTYRSLAEHVVNQTSKMLRLREGKECQTALVPLPGAASKIEASMLSQEFGLEMSDAEHLVNIYGSRSYKLAKYIQEFGLKGHLCPSHSHLKAEVLFAFIDEMAMTLEDFLTRRTHIRYSSCRGLDCIDTVADILNELAIFSEEELEEQKQSYLRKVEADLKVISAL